LICDHDLRAHVCGYDVNLTYPQRLPISTVQPSRRISTLWTWVASQANTTGLLQKRDQLDPYYGCSLFDELVDYATNFSFPLCASLVPFLNLLFVAHLPHVQAPGAFDVHIDLFTPSVILTTSQRIPFS
jgi:hypothetical protein